MKRDTREPEPEPESGAGDLGSEIMTLQEVADYLNCHYTTVYRRLVQQGGIPVGADFRRRADFRLRRADLRKWIAQQHARQGESEPIGPGRYKRKS
jgi:excisionase family DNA binding protein